MRKNLIFILAALTITIQTKGQETLSQLAGKVSYITAQNIYVKFESTENIHVGDTIFRSVDNILIPLFIVENLSSVSCVGLPLGPSDVKADDPVVAKVRIKIKKEKPQIDQPANQIARQDTTSTGNDSVPKPIVDKRRQSIQGSLSLSSYSNLSNTPVDNSQRMRYTLSLRANNLADSRFSVESYISFSHQLKRWAEVQANIFSALKIYSLALQYDISKKTNISFGRKVNINLSNIGAVDGLQAETSIGQMTFGAIAGSRPNDADYNVNIKLLEYGAFVGHSVLGKMGRMQSSLAFFEQKNTGITDRRFVYFQHDNSLLKNLFLFTSFELDLYKVVEGVPKNEPTLTGLYASLRYRIFKPLTVFVSYDARKNVIYYETYKGIADRLLEDATRQGFQARINYRLGVFGSLGVTGGYRFRTNDINPNENLNGYFTVNQIPGIKVSATLTANLLKTNYMDGSIYGLRLYRDIIPGKMYGEFNYRFVDYHFVNSDSRLVQNIAQANLSWQFNNKMSFSLDYELTLEEVARYHRIYVSLNLRF